MKAMTPAQKLREVLVGPALEVVPGCFDALSAKLVADAGFKVTFMSGFAVSAARFGLPDTGLISFAEMLDSLRNCVSGAVRIPLIADGDTGIWQRTQRAAHGRRVCACRRRRCDDRGSSEPEEMWAYSR